MVVMHGSRYPLVCGLCKQSLIGCGNVNDSEAMFTRLLVELGVESIPEHMALLKSYQLNWNWNNSQLLKDIGRKEKEDAIRDLLRLDELKSIYSSFDACSAFATQSVTVLANAMELHEKKHVQILRRQYCPNFTDSVDRDQIAREAHVNCLLEGVGRALTDIYRENHLSHGEEHEIQIEMEHIEFDPNVWASPVIQYICDPFLMTPVLFIHLIISRLEQAFKILRCV